MSDWRIQQEEDSLCRWLCAGRCCEKSGLGIVDCSRSAEVWDHQLTGVILITTTIPAEREEGGGRGGEEKWTLNNNSTRNVLGPGIQPLRRLQRAGCL